MKKFLLLFLILPLCCGYNTTTAKAESLYLRIITTDTPLYSDKQGENLLFYLPYTYYVKLLDSDGEYLHVQCEASTLIDGYVPKGLLFDDGQEVKNSYPDITVSPIDVTVLYKDKNFTETISYAFSSRQMQFYGYYVKDSEQILCVGYNGKLGYVRENEVSSFTLPNHENPLTFLKTEETAVEEIKEDNASTDYPEIRYVIIICLVLSVILAIFIAFKKKPLKETAITSYYDENDFE